MPTLTVPATAFADALTAVISSAPKDGARPILSTVLVRFRSRPFAVELVACDNFRCAFADVEGEVAKSGTLEPFMLPLADARAILKAIPKAPKRGALPPLVFAWRKDGILRASLNGWSLDIRPPLGQYPNVDTIAPKGSVRSFVSVNASLLAELALAMGGKDGTILIEVRHPGKVTDYGTGAYVIRPNGKNGRRHALLMPVRVQS